MLPSSRSSSRPSSTAHPGNPQPFESPSPAHHERPASRSSGFSRLLQRVSPASRRAEAYQPLLSGRSGFEEQRIGVEMMDDGEVSAVHSGPCVRCSSGYRTSVDPGHHAICGCLPHLHSSISLEVMPTTLSAHRLVTETARNARPRRVRRPRPSNLNRIGIPVSHSRMGRRQRPVRKVVTLHSSTDTRLLPLPSPGALKAGNPSTRKPPRPCPIITAPWHRIPCPRVTDTLPIPARRRPNPGTIRKAIPLPRPRMNSRLRHGAR